MKVCCPQQQNPEASRPAAASAAALLQSTAAVGWRRFDSTLPSVQQKQMLLEVLRISEMKEEMPRRIVIEDNNNSRRDTEIRIKEER